MAIYYDFYKNPESPDGTTKGAHPRLNSVKTISTLELLNKAKMGSNLAPEVFELALTSVIDQMKIAMAQGMRVHINELGFFAPALSATLPDDKRKKMPIVKANGINFKPEKDVKRYMASIETIWMAKTHRTLKEIDQNELDEKVRAYFEDHDTLTRARLEEICPELSRTSCCEYLKNCVESGKLRNVNTKNSPVYMIKNL